MNLIVFVVEEFLVLVFLLFSNIWFFKEFLIIINVILEEVGKGVDEKWMLKCLDYKEFYSLFEKL